MRMIAYRTLTCLTILLLFSPSIPAQIVTDLLPGDLLFVAQPQDNAITQVTRGVHGLAIDHVAIAHRIGGNHGPLYAIEAIPELGVTLTPLDSLLARESAATIVVGRVSGLDASASVRKALSLLGRPYDNLFLPEDNAIYCSELVQLCYVDTRGRRIFGTIPMSFTDASGQITTHWRAFYATHGRPVPQGLPGTNPGELSRRPEVNIIGNISNGRY